ncbi:MFS transporter [Streptomyces sp. NPDC093252]|uniref:MFS transporter n=1 Tax=Streptomyces sp. NPDC093252 TaxID=3154980 RepID=UPI003423BA58
MSERAATASAHTSLAVSLETSRRLLTAFFAGLGAAMAVWGARLPSVQDAAQIGAGRLSLVLLAAALGMVAGLQLGCHLAHRHGPSRLLAGPGAVFGLALVLLAQCRSLSTLIAAATLFGLAHGVLDVGVNSAAVNCQTAYGRPIMASLHAACSVGGVGGAALAAGAARISHTLLFTVVGALVALAAAVAAPALRLAPQLDADPAGAGAHRDPGSSSRRTVWLLAALAAACLLSEGAALDWSAVHLSGLGATEAVAAAAYALYSAAMAVGRLLGDRLTERYGAATVVRAGAVVAAVGLGGSLLVGNVAGALAGWAALGLGLSITVPSLITAAGRGGPRTVGAVTAVGYIGLVAGPAAIGALATLTSLPLALALPAVLAAVVALTSRRALEPR